MLNLNRVELIGRMGREPELRNTQDGKKVATINFATSETWKDRGGQRQETTEWHRLVAWGKTAELFEKHVRKGDYLRIVGSLKTRKWTDQQGQDRYSTEINVREVGFLEPKDGQPESAVAEDEIPY
ncbi:MAG: single-stranded DNA-binding protein [Rhodospirillaceae bacterium]|nr:single-stranded DNA-binding protein [Rhodospirillaceae bacterium]